MRHPEARGAHEIGGRLVLRDGRDVRVVADVDPKGSEQDEVGKRYG